MRGLALLLAMLAAGCKKSPAQPDAGPVAPKKAFQYPEPRFERIPGWLGFAAVAPGTKGRHYWTPAHPSAQAVLFTDAWQKVDEGAPVAIASASGLTQGTYAGTGMSAYGCEQNTAQMATFRTAAPLPEGPVWIAPPEAISGVESVPIQEQKPADLPDSVIGKEVNADLLRPGNARVYRIGPMQLLLEKSAPLRGELSVFEGQIQVATGTFEKGQMEGGDAEPLNLFGTDEVGVPVPLAAWRLGKDGPLVAVIGLRGYEGHLFWVLAKSGQETRLIQEGEGLYFCAF